MWARRKGIQPKVGPKPFGGRRRPISKFQKGPREHLKGLDAGANNQGGNAKREGPNALRHFYWPKTVERRDSGNPTSPGKGSSHNAKLTRHRGTGATRPARSRQEKPQIYGGVERVELQQRPSDERTKGLHTLRRDQRCYVEEHLATHEKCLFPDTILDGRHKETAKATKGRKDCESGCLLDPSREDPGVGRVHVSRDFTSSRKKEAFCGGQSNEKQSETARGHLERGEELE